ncbi:hypothetical protein N9F13_03310, partial [Akkermansiaceae bacterium]|nr:hypothetical protein [Akkermansiaceae bacterium]
GGHFQGYHHAEVPTFHFKVGANRFDLQFQVDEKGAATLALDGTLHEPQSFSLAPIIRGKEETWTVSELPAELKFTIPVKNPWRPIGVVPAPLIQKAETAVSKVVLPAGYSAEAILPPVDPQGRKQLFEPLGMDLAPDGSLIVSTRTAGLWKLKNGLWTQIAEGLLDALGVIVESESEIIVGQKPELTRLRDEDGDGWMDHYETLSDDFQITANYHEYLHGPAKDASGNYYIQLNLAEHPNKGIYKANGNWMGAQGGFRGWSLKVTPEGKMTSFARGLRSPAGLATGPDGKLYYTENQGEYQGTSKLFLLEEGKFYGHPSGLVDLPKMNPSSPEIAWDAVKATKEKALALMPQSRLANSPGSPVWAPENDQFGPFAGHMFVGDQTLSNLFRILPKANHEAALIPFAHGFPSGVMRVLFDEQEIALETDPSDASSKPPFPTPLGYWAFDDQGAATTADFSPNGNDATITGGATYVAGHTGGPSDFALDLDGVDDAATTSLTLSNIGTFTMAGWIKMSVDQTAFSGLFGQNDILEFGFDVPGNVHLWSNPGGPINTPLEATNEWVHIAFVGDTSGRTIFINGEPAVTGVAGTPLVASDFFFNIGGGGIFRDTANYFQGQIDDVGVWEVSMSPQLIQGLANGTISPVPGLNQEFAITEFTRDGNDLTFKVQGTVQGVDYIIEESDSLLGPWEEITDFVGAQGAAETEVPFQIEGNAVPKNFFRATVLENN